MKHKIQVVILPTADKTNIGLLIYPRNNRKLLYYIDKAGKSTGFGNGSIPHYSYITVSQDREPIKEGDWVIITNNNNELLKTTKASLQFIDKNDRKIIATDDPKLTSKRVCFQCDGTGETVFSGTYTTQRVCDVCHGVKTLGKPIPQVQQSFLKEYVANPDGEWEVEYEEIIRCYKCNKLEEDCIHTSTNCLGYFEGIDKLKLDQDNTVNITSVEEKMYSKMEVLRIANKAVSDYLDDNEIIGRKFLLKDNWIKGNL